MVIPGKGNDVLNPTHMQARILSRIAEEDRGYATPCWISNRAAQPNGYTKIGVNGRTCLTHRVAYEAWIGTPAEGYEIDHLCRVTACCNPAHLEAVTQAENIRRKCAAQTTCKEGHPFDAVTHRSDGTVNRRCKRCDARRSSKYQASKRAA